MKFINNYLMENYPPHPDDIIYKDKNFSDGIKEIDVWNYWISVKRKLVNWINGRNVTFLLRIDDKLIIKRNVNDRPIKLTLANYDQLISGRTNVVYVTHPKITNYIVIDIDIGEGLSKSNALTALKFCRKILDKEYNVARFEALHSSSKGIHLIAYLHRLVKLDSLRIELEELLRNSVPEGILVNVKGRGEGTINLDLTPMYSNNIHIARYSLTKDFFICDDVKNGLRKIDT